MSENKFSMKIRKRSAVNHSSSPYILPHDTMKYRPPSEQKKLQRGKWSKEEKQESINQVFAGQDRVSPSKEGPSEKEGINVSEKLDKILEELKESNKRLSEVEKSIALIEKDSKKLESVPDANGVKVIISEQTKDLPSKDFVKWTAVLEAVGILGVLGIIKWLTS